MKVLDGLLNTKVANSSTPFTAAEKCQDGWVTYPGSTSCYLFSHNLSNTKDRMKTWEDASKYCTSKKSNLLCTSDLREHDFVSQRAEAAGGYWTGFNDKDVEGNFVCKGN
jgi:hypothetical protein